MDVHGEIFLGCVCTRISCGDCRPFLGPLEQGLLPWHDEGCTPCGFSCHNGGFPNWGHSNSWMVYLLENPSINGWELEVPPWLWKPPNSIWLWKLLEMIPIDQFECYYNSTHLTKTHVCSCWNTRNLSIIRLKASGSILWLQPYLDPNETWLYFIGERKANSYPLQPFLNGMVAEFYAWVIRIIFTYIIYACVCRSWTTCDFYDLMAEIYME